MRVLLPAMSAFLVSLSVAGCGGADPTNLRHGVPAPGSAEIHGDDADGENDVDPGNPNASAKQAGPQNAGTTGDVFVRLSTATPAVDLGATTDVDVTVESRGFTGPAVVSVSGLPASTTAAFASGAATVTVNVGAAPATTRLTLRAAMAAIPSAPNTSSPIVVAAKTSSGQATANANFKVNPRLTLVIPMNLDALRAAGGGVVYRNEWGDAFGTTPTTLRTQTGNGIVVLVRNADSAPHVIHGQNGFAHGDSNVPVQPNAFEMQNGAPRQRTLNPGANTNGYPHDGGNGPSVSFRIAVAAAP